MIFLANYEKRKITRTRGDHLIFFAKIHENSRRSFEILCFSRVAKRRGRRKTGRDERSGARRRPQLEQGNCSQTVRTRPPTLTSRRQGFNSRWRRRGVRRNSRKKKNHENSRRSFDFFFAKIHENSWRSFDFFSENSREFVKIV